MRHFIYFFAILLVISACRKDVAAPLEGSESPGSLDPRASLVGDWVITERYWTYNYDSSTDSFYENTAYTEYPNATINLGSESDELEINLSGGSGSVLVGFEDGNLYCRYSCTEDNWSPEADGWINEAEMEYYLGCLCGFTSSSRTYKGTKL